MVTPTIDDQEVLYRAIRPYPFLWNPQVNRPSTAAFKDPNGLSVDRDGGRPECEIIEEYQSRFDLRAIVSITAGECRQIEVYPVASPSKYNPWHAELHDSENVKLINKSKQLKLARACKLVEL